MSVHIQLLIDTARGIKLSKLKKTKKPNKSEQWPRELMSRKSSSTLERYLKSNSIMIRTEVKYFTQFPNYAFFS